MKKYLLLTLKIIAFLFGSQILMALLILPFFIFKPDLFDSSDSIIPMFTQEVLLLLTVSLLSYLILHYWEKLPLSDLGISARNRGKDILYGALTAATIYCISFIVLLIPGWISIEKIAFHPADLLFSFLLMILVGLAEEIMSRGFILGRMLNAGVHPWLALLLSSLIFSLMHIANDGFSFYAFLNLVLAGILLGVAYLHTRNLWFSISLHTFWNWIQGQLGFAVSGQSFGEPLVKIQLSDNTLMNGGKFGFESSLTCTILMIVFIFVIARYISPKLKIQETKIIINNETTTTSSDYTC